MGIIATRPRITLSQIDEETGEVNYGDLNTQDDTLLVFDTPSAVTSQVKITFPTNPQEGQLFGATTIKSLDEVVMYSQYYPVVEPATSLSPANPKMWSFSYESAKWVSHT